VGISGHEVFTGGPIFYPVRIEVKNMERHNAADTTGESMSQVSDDNNKLKCVIYARSATSNANDLQRQSQACHGYILERPDLAFAGLYVEEPASGLSPNRLQLHFLLDAAQQNPRYFDCVVIEDASRLARDVGLLAEIAKKLAIAGIAILSACSGFHRCELVLLAINCDSQSLEGMRQRVLKGQCSRSAFAMSVKGGVKSASAPQRNRWLRSPE
jgi:predicted site-specific integrase-resolvase